jgi:hypothetical protein
MTFALAISMACAATLVAATENWFQLKTPGDGSAIEMKNKAEIKMEVEKG